MSKVQRQLVNSSDIKSIGYDAFTSILEIQFLRDGSVYQYYFIPQDVHIGLMNSSSHGKYFNENIKDKYSYKKVY